MANPAPLNLSDTEILDWLAENVSLATYHAPTDEVRGGWWLDCDLMTPTQAETLREAVCLAAARWAEINDCFLP